MQLKKIKYFKIKFLKNLYINNKFLIMFYINNLDEEQIYEIKKFLFNNSIKYFKLKNKENKVIWDLKKFQNQFSGENFLCYNLSLSKFLETYKFLKVYNCIKFLKIDKFFLSFDYLKYLFNVKQIKTLNNQLIKTSKLLFLSIKKIFIIINKINILRILNKIYANIKPIN